MSNRRTPQSHQTQSSATTTPPTRQSTLDFYHASISRTIGTTPSFQSARRVYSANNTAALAARTTPATSTTLTATPFLSNSSNTQLGTPPQSTSTTRTSTVAGDAISNLFSPQSNHFPSSQQQHNPNMPPASPPPVTRFQRSLQSSASVHPQFRSKAVCELFCRHCDEVVCTRGMKAILLGDTRVELFSTDSPPCRVQLVENDYMTRNCQCRIRDVACLQW
ncbi:FAM72 protein-domain-containing protein [Chytriomyces sp. MP71]|nr:FAM72 protein-domain-containing protein [Chytriomyces sp. MP71]